MGMQVCLAILSNFKSNIYPITKLYVNQMLVNMFILNERHKMNMIGNSNRLVKRDDFKGVNRV